VTDDSGLLEETAEDLFEDAPCGYLTTRLDGTIVRVNRTFETWTGLRREELLGRRRFQDLLAPGGRIYHETHYAPLLQMQGSVREIALELVRADGSRLAALVNSTLVADASGQPRVVKTTVFDATDRRRYEQELLRARRREQEIAQHLQRSLLSGELPAADGLEVEVAYRPAEAGIEVGGDWYDAFWLEDEESVGFVVGDVVGRGLEAAATMGQLRSAVRALAATGIGPAALLDALDAYASRHKVGQMATVVYAQLELASGRLIYACAGHPPPVLVGPDGPPRFLLGGRSTPLDIYTEDHQRADAGCVLSPGSSLLLYTDGLIERRSETLDEGMARLLEHLGQSRPADGLAGVLVDALYDSDQGDDVCVLVACVGAAARRGQLS
jgi:phosphoserine phosphatase RsbU/P